MCVFNSVNICISGILINLVFTLQLCVKKNPSCNRIKEEVIAVCDVSDYFSEKHGSREEEE